MTALRIHISKPCYIGLLEIGGYEMTLRGETNIKVSTHGGTHTHTHTHTHTAMTLVRRPSKHIILHVCAVAQYAVLEANGKISGIWENSHLYPSKPLDQFGCRFKYITTSAQRVDVQNLIKIDSAVAPLCMREKNEFERGFLGDCL